MKVSEINDKLIRGDVKMIASVARVSVDYVWRVLSGDRPARTPRAQRIIDVATRIITQREDLIAEYQHAEEVEV